MTQTQVTLLHVEDCPSWRTAYERLTSLAAELDLAVEHRQVDTTEEAEELGFHGSPAVTVDGRDVFADRDQPVAFACRVYPTPDGPSGSPTVDQLREVLS